MDFQELFRATSRQAASLERVGHRPWPLPQGRWLMGQSWLDLLFLHWRVPEEALRPLIPHGLAIETFEGEAWIGVTPFQLTGLRLHGTIPLPRLSEFPELNVRTYVTDGEKGGIWFFSLDAAHAGAVVAARRFYHLPYHRARMEVRRAGGTVRFASTREEPGSSPATLRVRYGGYGPAAPAQRGTLEYFLTERYCLYASDRGRVLRADIHHPPWQLRDAEVSIEDNSMLPPGVEVEGEPLAHMAERQDVLIWPPGNVEPASGVPPA